MVFVTWLMLPNLRMHECCIRGACAGPSFVVGHILQRFANEYMVNSFSALQFRHTSSDMVFVLASARDSFSMSSYVTVAAHSPLRVHHCSTIPVPGHESQRVHACKMPVTRGNTNTFCYEARP